jgi:hypothetical protein
MIKFSNLHTRLKQMSLVTINKIVCEQTCGNSFKYELDTNLFNESIFKMCIECGVFVHDFSNMFCSCGKKLDYVNVSDVDELKLFLNHLSLNDHPKPIKPVEYPMDYDSDSDGSGDSGDFDEIGYHLKNGYSQDDHVCNIGEDCSNPDCIDCCEREYSPEASGSDSVDPDYYQAWVNDGVDCDDICDCSDCENDNEDDYELDSVS